MGENIEKKYNKAIIIISIFVFIIVVILSRISLKNLGYSVEPLTFLPPIYATINGITAVILVIAVVAIKNGKQKLHENLMKSAIICSIVFLMMYVAYHMTSESAKFGGEGIIKYIYFFILITHIMLSIAVVPLVLITYVKALTKQFDKHRKIAKITFPIWLYVAVTGVVVYLMISPYYV